MHSIQYNSENQAAGKTHKRPHPSPIDLFSSTSLQINQHSPAFADFWNFLHFCEYAFRFLDSSIFAEPASPILLSLRLMLCRKEFTFIASAIFPESEIHLLQSRIHFQGFSDFFSAFCSNIIATEINFCREEFNFKASAIFSVPFSPILLFERLTHAEKNSISWPRQFFQSLHLQYCCPWVQCSAEISSLSRPSKQFQHLLHLQYSFQFHRD